MEVASPAMPDLDRRIRYTPRWQRREGIARLRVFHGEQVAVVTELDDNPGMSVTNAAEEVAQVVEDLLGVRFAPHPTLMVDVSWTLVEHYARDAGGHMSLSAVRFTGRDAEGALEGPAWTAIREGELPWLWEALAPAAADLPDEDGAL